MRNDGVELVPAPLLRRGVAFVIDWLLLNLINLGFTVMLNLESEQKQELIGLSLVTSATYHIVSLVVKSATPGKTAMGFLCGPGGRPCVPMAILRYRLAGEHHDAVHQRGHQSFSWCLPILGGVRCTIGSPGRW
jgi:hypothetical protein